MTPSELEIIANHSGRHLAECETNEARDNVLGLLRKISTQFYLKDRYFSIEKFNDRVLEVELLHRERLADLPTLHADVFSMRGKRGTATIRKKATPRKKSKKR